MDEAVHQIIKLLLMAVSAVLVAVSIQFAFWFLLIPAIDILMTICETQKHLARQLHK